MVDGDGLVEEVELPQLTPRQEAKGGPWRTVVSIDVHGLAGKEATTVTAELFDAATGMALATTSREVADPAPRAAWAVIASSAQGGSAAAAFGGDPATMWHSRYGGDRPDPPHWIGLEFAEPAPFTGVSYLPRQAGFTNGVARSYRLEVREDGKAWREVAAGETDRAAQADRREAVEIRLEDPLHVQAFRLVIGSDWSGGGFGSAAEVSPLDVDLRRDEQRVVARQRLWLEIPEALAENLEGHRFGVRLSIKGADAVVVGRPRVARYHPAPNGKLLGKANGHLGPDKLGVGLLGFTGLLEHRADALSVMEVRAGGPAALAGLERGDLLVAVGDRPLPENDLAPGWNWFHHSHEAVLGRAGEEALADQGSLDLQVLRAGKPVTLAVKLPERPAFGSLDPATDPAAAAMLDDLLTWLCEHQREDGSWSRDIIRTTFSALALMATGDGKHEARVRRAVDWSLKRYSKPEAYGNLGFWHGAYAGILYSEWHLRTADERVLPHLAALRDWAVAGQHESIWGVPALGHGPPHLPYGNKSLVAPSCHLLVYEALARRCGMESALWELLLPYMELAWSDPADGGHGGLGYNKSFKDKDEFWFRTGHFAMACHLRGERLDMRDAMIAFMRERHPWIRNSHAYGEPGGAWGLLALNLVSPEAFAEVMKEHAWWFSLAWEPGHGLRWTTPHMGEEDLLGQQVALQQGAAEIAAGNPVSYHLVGDGIGRIGSETAGMPRIPRIFGEISPSRASIPPG